MRAQVNSFLNVILKILKAARAFQLLKGNGADVGHDILMDILREIDLYRTLEHQRHFKPHPVRGGVCKVGGDGIELDDTVRLCRDFIDALALLLAMFASGSRGMRLGAA